MRRRLFAALMIGATVMGSSGCVSRRVCREKVDAAFDAGVDHGLYLVNRGWNCRDPKTGRFMPCPGATK